MTTPFKDDIITNVLFAMSLFDIFCTYQLIPNANGKENHVMVMINENLNANRLYEILNFSSAIDNALSAIGTKNLRYLSPLAHNNSASNNVQSAIADSPLPATNRSKNGV
jgi:hypothetical protein